MIEIIAAVAVVFLCVFMYLKGVKDGMRTAKGQAPKFIQTKGKTGQPVPDKHIEAIKNYDPFEMIKKIKDGTDGSN